MPRYESIPHLPARIRSEAVRCRGLARVVNEKAPTEVRA